MELALGIVNAVVVLAVAWNTYTAQRLKANLNGWLSDAIAEEVRKQDDRIRKQVERARGPGPTPAGQGLDEGYIVGPGQPYRRG